MTPSQSSQNESNSVSVTFQESLLPSRVSETRQGKREGVVELHDGSVSFESDSNWVVSTFSDEAHCSVGRNLDTLATASEGSFVFSNKPNDITIYTPTKDNNIHQNCQNNYIISDSVNFDFPPCQRLKPQLNNELSDTATFKQLISISVKLIKQKARKLDLASFLLGTLLSFGTARCSKRFFLLVYKWTVCLFLVYILWESSKRTKYQRVFSWLLRKFSTAFI